MFMNKKYTIVDFWDDISFGLLKIADTASVEIQHVIYHIKKQPYHRKENPFKMFSDYYYEKGENSVTNFGLTGHWI